MGKASATPVVPSEPVLRRIRVPFVQRASLETTEGTSDVFIVDLGLRGVFVESADRLPDGARVTIRFPLPGNSIPVCAHCRVVWWRPADATDARRPLPGGHGLEFVDLSLEETRRVRGHVLGYMSRSARMRSFSQPWPGDEEVAR